MNGVNPVSAKGPRNKMIRGDLLQKAAALFAEKGFASTNIQDIADAVGLSRPSLYYYFKNKDEVLTALVEEATTYPVTILDKHRRDSRLQPADRLRNAMAELVAWIIRSPLVIKVLETNESRLPVNLAEEHQQAKRRVLKAFVDMITDGIQSGDFRPVDPRVAAFALIGMGNWTAWWYAPDGDRTAVEVAEQFAEMAVRSLSWADVPTSQGSSVDQAFALLKTNIALLENAISIEKSGTPKG